MMEKFTKTLTKVCTAVVVILMLALSVLVAAALAVGCVGVIRWGLGL